MSRAWGSARTIAESSVVYLKDHQHVSGTVYSHGMANRPELTREYHSWFMPYVFSGKLSNTLVLLFFSCSCWCFYVDIPSLGKILDRTHCSADRVRRHGITRHSLFCSWYGGHHTVMAYSRNTRGKVKLKKEMFLIRFQLSWTPKAF